MIKKITLLLSIGLLLFSCKENVPQNNDGEWCEQTSTTVTIGCSGVGMIRCDGGSSTSYVKDC